MKTHFIYIFGLLSRLLILNVQCLKSLYVALRASEQQVFFCEAHSQFLFAREQWNVVTKNVCLRQADLNLDIICLGSL